MTVSEFAEKFSKDKKCLVIKYDSVPTYRNGKTFKFLDPDNFHIRNRRVEYYIKLKDSHYIVLAGYNLPNKRLYPEDEKLLLKRADELIEIFGGKLEKLIDNDN